MMEKENLLKRTHGGAIPSTEVRKKPAPPDERFGKGSLYEQAIVDKALTYLKPQDTVFIGGAAIHYVMATKLPENLPLTVVTNSLKVADSLRTIPSIETILIGGILRESGNMTDALTYEWIQRFTFDIAYLTGGGVSPRGISTATPEVANLGKLISNQSKKRIGLFPHYKMGVDAFVVGNGVSELDFLITDEEAHESEVAKLRNEGVDVIIAQLGGKVDDLS